MSSEIDIAYVPQGCPPECPILQSSQSSAFAVAAEAQALFQGFLKCLDKMLPQSQLNPEFKKGAQMLGHFTKKLDSTLAQQYANATQCEFVAGGGVCPHKQFTQLEGEIDIERVKVERLSEENRQLQSQCLELTEQVDTLIGELSKRRTQYNNRILIDIFEAHYRVSDFAGKGSFFDIVPRERLGEFFPFIRNIVLGPAVAEQFDEQIELAIEPFKNEFGVIPVHKWKDLLEDKQVRKVIAWVTDILYERSQRRDAFRSIVRRKSPVSLQKMPKLVALFDSMGIQGAMDSIAC